MGRVKIGAVKIGSVVHGEKVTNTYRCPCGDPTCDEKVIVLASGTRIEGSVYEEIRGAE